MVENSRTAGRECLKIPEWQEGKNKPIPTSFRKKSCEGGKNILPDPSCRKAIHSHMCLLFVQCYLKNFTESLPKFAVEPWCAKNPSHLRQVRSGKYLVSIWEWNAVLDPASGFFVCAVVVLLQSNAVCIVSIMVGSRGWTAHANTAGETPHPVHGLDGVVPSMPAPPGQILSNQGRLQTLDLVQVGRGQPLMWQTFLGCHSLADVQGQQFGNAIDGCGRDVIELGLVKATIRKTGPEIWIPKI